MDLRPVVSEKSIALADANNTYVFYVPRSANKHTIARDIAARFDVSVVDVKTAVLKGKQKRWPVQRGRRFVTGKRSDMKKAYVTLADGDVITLFEGGE